jgi:hypothetical protein
LHREELATLRASSLRAVFEGCTGGMGALDTEEKQKKPKKTFKKEGKADGGFAATAAPKKLYDKDGPKAKPSFDKGKAKPKETAKAPKAPKEKPNAATIQVRKPLSAA